MTSNGYGHPLLMTVFLSASDGNPHAYWLARQFSIIARYLERMLSPAHQSAAQAG